MASSPNHVDSDGSHSSDDDSDEHTTIVRGVALLKKIKRLTCRNTKKIPLKCDPFGKPIGKYATVFQQYVGYLAREKVSIAYRNWKSVPEQTKIDVYDNLMSTFDIPSDKMDKKMIISNINTKWKTFKTSLGNRMKDVETGEYPVEPPEQYPCVDQDAWTSFIQHRSTEDFQDLSKANSERSKKKEHSYRASSMGYARLAEKILKKKKMDPETTTVSRDELWKAARCNDDGTYADERTSKMAKKIDEIKEKISEGIIRPTGREDTLSLALEKDEHPGRLRGVGSGIGVKKYFGPSKSTLGTRSVRERILESRLEEVLLRVSALEKQLQMKSQGSIPEPQSPTNEEQELNIDTLVTHMLGEDQWESDEQEPPPPPPPPPLSQSIIRLRKPKKKRMRELEEQRVEKLKKKKIKCSNCEEEGHYKSKCKNPSKKPKPTRVNTDKGDRHVQSSTNLPIKSKCKTPSKKPKPTRVNTDKGDRHVQSSTNLPIKKRKDARKVRTALSNLAEAAYDLLCIEDQIQCFNTTRVTPLAHEREEQKRPQRNKYRKLYTVKSSGNAPTAITSQLKSATKSSRQKKRSKKN